MSKHGLQVIENDALVVLCFDEPPGQRFAVLSHHGVKSRLRDMGFTFTTSKVHSMLSRARGRVRLEDDCGPYKVWTLTAAGMEYRRHVLAIIQRLDDWKRRSDIS